MAIAGMILGICALVSVIIGIAAASSYGGQAAGVAFIVIAFILAIIGFILSLVATIKKSTPRKGPAIAGLIMCSLFMIAIIIIYFAAFVSVYR